MPTPPFDDQAAPSTSDLPTMPMGIVPDLAVTVGTGSPDPVLIKRPQIPQAPAVIAGYRRMRQLGVGGMGEVHLAQHERLNRQVALKLMRPNVATDQEFAKRFLRESKAMAAVNHPNVVAIHDAGEADGYLYMAIEFVDGIDLSKLLRTRGIVEEATAIKIMIGCCKGLEAIHLAGLVHRDIKPGNIFLDRKGEPKIGDLGLARHVDGDDRMTMTGSAWGTPAYMPPEQLRGVADIDIRADLYALGAALYTILTGSEPFSGATSFVVTTKIMTEVAPDPRQANRTLSAAVAAIIRTCLEKERDKRYPTPTALRVDLERARDGLPLAFAQVVGGATAAVQVTAASPLPGTVAKTSQPVSPGTPARQHLPVHDPATGPLPVKLLIYGIAIGVIALGWWSLQGGTTAGVRPAKTPDNAPLLGEGPVTTGTSLKPTSSWMSDMGRDQFGDWAAIRVGNQAIRLRLLPATQQFYMGSPPDEPGRQPTETRHEVELTRSFWISETEVTASLWQAVTGSESPQTASARQPARGLSWNDAQNFLLTLNRRVPNLDASLPTEAQWEYACRGTSAEAFTSGANPDPGERLAAPERGPREVGQGTPNRYGLFDLHGNVSEWCVDSWDGTTPLPSRPTTDPQENFGRWAVLRGGSYASSIVDGRSAARHGQPPHEPRTDGGLRFIVTDH